MDDEVLPRLEHIARVVELCRKGEIVVGPAQTFTETKGEAEELHVLVGVVIIRVVVVVGIIAVTREVVVVIVVVIAIVVVAGVHVALLGVGQRHGELVGTFAAKPWVEE